MNDRVAGSTAPGAANGSDGSGVALPPTAFEALRDHVLAVVDRGGTVAAMAAEEGLPFRAVLTASDLGFPYEGG
jgi:hypothetical protein